MKKTLSLILVLLMTLSLFSACGTEPEQQTEAPIETGSPVETPTEIPAEEPPAAPDEVSEPESEPVNMRIAGLKGPTSIGMIQVMEKNDSGESANDYTFTVAGAADEITPLIIKGELDIAAVPANLASVLYNRTEGEIQVLAVNTLGVLYIVERGEAVTSLEDLRGKTIYATGKGSTPEYNLRYLLTSAGLDPDKDVTIEWKTEPSEVVAIMSEEPGSIAMMPQPYVTSARGQIEDLRVAVDLTAVWDELDTGSAMVTGVVLARREFVEQYPEQIDAFLNEYKESAEFVNANVAEAAQLVEKFDIIKAAVAEKAIPYCNICFMQGSEMRSALEGYLEVLFEQNLESVGGALPGADFYYGA